MRSTRLPSDGPSKTCVGASASAEFLAGSESGEALGISEHRSELCAGRAPHAAPVTWFSELYVDFLPYRALIIIVENVAVALPYGVPRWDLCHQEGPCLGWG